MVALRFHKDQDRLFSEAQPEIVRRVNGFIARTPYALARQSREDYLQHAYAAFLAGLWTHPDDPMVCVTSALISYSRQAGREVCQLEDVEAREEAQEIAVPPILAELLKQLTPRERRVIALRYGLGKCNPHTQQEVADRLNVSQQCVGQIEFLAKQHMASAAIELGLGPES